MNQNWTIPFTYLKYTVITIVHFAVIGTNMGMGYIRNVYIRNDLCYDVKSFCPIETEIFLELWLANMKPRAVGSIYQPPC